MKILYKGATYLGLILSIQLVLYFTLAYALFETDRATGKTEYAQQVNYLLSRVGNRLFMSLGALCFYGFYSDKAYLQEFKETRLRGQSDLSGLKELKRNHYATAADIKAIERSSNSTDLLLNELNRCADFYQKKSTAFGVTFFFENFVHVIGPHMTELRRELKRQIQQHAQSMLAKDVENMAAAVRVVFYVALLCNILLSIVLLFLFSRSITNPLRTMTENVSRMLAGTELLPPLIGSNEITRVDHSFHDMARALSEAAAKDKAVFSNMPVGLLTCSEELTIEKANPKACRLLEFDKDDLIGKKLADIAPDAARHMSLPDATKMFRCWCTRQSGERGAVDVTVATFLDGGSRKYLVSLLDATHRLEIERLKQDFMLVVSEDLQTPLSSVSNCLAELQDSPHIISERGKVAALKAARSAERLTRLARDLIEVANLDSGGILLNREPCLLAELLGAAVDDVRDLAATKGVGLKTTITCELTELTLDAPRVTQVIVNLLSNAIKFSKPGDEINLSASTENDFVRISVKDQGRGIPAEQLATVFERFKQVQAADAQSGSGLGLAICKMLVEAHDGKIGVESAVGSGTTFYFLLPITT